MDLLATVRKEGTRGGTGDFKWSDVQSSSHREHYLGHSLMAPVGRWQKNRDLNWYARSDATGDDNEDPEQRAVRERKEEIRRVKEMEEDALARALGLPVPDRTNANMEVLGTRKEIDRVLKDAVRKDDVESEKGLGFGVGSSMSKGRPMLEERIEGNADVGDREMQHALNEYKRRHGDRDTKRRVRSRSRSRERDRNRRHHGESGRDRERNRSHHYRRLSRDRDRDRRRSTSRSTGRDRKRHDRPLDRSRSPYRPRHSEKENNRRKD